MYHSVFHRGRRSALAPAAFLLLAICLLAGSAQAADVPRFVVGDVLETSAGNLTNQVVVAKVDTTSLPVPYYTMYDVEENAGRWEIPRYWNHDQKVDETNLLDNLDARRVGHVDPVIVVVTDETITGGDMQYTGLSLAEATTVGAYPLEPEPGSPTSFPPSYVVGDILGNVSDPNHGSVVSRVYEDGGTTWYRVYFDVARSGDRWILPDLYLYDSFTPSGLDQNDMRRVAHADPHTVIINDSTTNTGEMSWYRLSLAEYFAGKIYDHMGYWYFNTGDILGNQTSATRYIVGAATKSDTGPSHYTLYEVVRSADGWEIPGWVNAGVPLEVPLGAQLDTIPFDLVDHTDPHFAIVTDASVANGLTYAGLSLGEILEGTPGYPVELPPVGGDRGYFLVSTVPAGADVYLVDISGTRHLQGNTGAGPLNVTIMLTATPMKQIVANLSGYREATHAIVQYPAKGQTVPVGLTLQPAGGGTPYRTDRVPGRVQAEDYNLGGEGVAYHDTTPGNTGGAYRRDGVDIETAGAITNVGWIRDGEYLRYTVNVAQTGDYYMALRVASPHSYRNVVVLVDDDWQEMWVLVQNTGSFERFATAVEWSTRTRPSAGVTATMTPAPTATGGFTFGKNPVHLTAGTHTLTLRFVGDGQNLDWIEFTAAEPASGGIPYKPLSIPGTIQAEDYNLGGQNVGYSDTTTGNSGGAYRHDDVDIEVGGSGYNVGWIREGEWLTYTADVASAGQYTLTARAASPNSGRTILVLVDNSYVATIAVPRTGSFSTWQTASVQVPLAAGQHTLRLMFTGDGQNIDWVAFSAEGTTPPITPTPTPTPEAGGASFTAAPLTAAHGTAVKFTVTPASGKSVSSAWWSFDATAHLNTWNSRNVNPTFFYPAKGTFSPLVKLTYSDGSTETVQRTGYITAT